MKLLDYLRIKLKKTTFSAIIIAISIVQFLVIFPRIVPSINLPDRGIFVSVAERLLAGNKLYIGVWENKDPIFYWMIAFGRIFSPFADIILEILYILIAAISLYFLTLSFNLRKTSSLIIGSIACPIIITGGNYYPGYSHLPGTALALASLAFLLRDRYFFSGLLLSFLLFTKLTTAPVLISMVIVLLIANWNLRKFKILLLGIIFGTAIPVTGLLVRGEFLGYIENFKFNIAYANENLYPSWPRPVAHILKSSNSISLSLSLIIILILIAEYSRLKKVNFSENQLIDWILWGITSAAFITSYIVISFTGLWDHHNQILYIPALLSIIIFTKFTELVFQHKPFLMILVTIILAILLSGPKPGTLLVTYKEMKQELLSLNSLSPEASAILTVTKTGTYARIGSNDDQGHAYGLRNLKLVCPYFHLYPSAPMSGGKFMMKTLDCLPSAETIIISSTFIPMLKVNSVAENPWIIFMSKVSQLLEEKYNSKIISGVMICSKLT
jgi:hypothetical protein